MKTVIIIPARLKSSRLANKVLLDIHGKSMIQKVYENVITAKGIDAVFIAVDNEKVFNVCKTFTKNVLMTSEKHESGTDRLAEAIEQIDCENIINVQGDEPLIDIQLIEVLAKELNAEKTQMVSAMHRIKTVEELKSHNCVKVTVDRQYNVLYFSRSIIPHHRDEWKTLLEYHENIPKSLNFFKHIGIYGYTKHFLKLYSTLESTYLERLEKLEQLRVLEHGYTIKMIETNYESIGVDTQEDLEKVRRLLS